MCNANENRAAEIKSRIVKCQCIKPCCEGKEIFFSLDFCRETMLIPALFALRGAQGNLILHRKKLFFLLVKSVCVFYKIAKLDFCILPQSYHDDKIFLRRLKPLYNKYDATSTHFQRKVYFRLTSRCFLQ